MDFAPFARGEADTVGKGERAVAMGIKRTNTIRGHVKLTRTSS